MSPSRTGPKRRQQEKAIAAASCRAIAADLFAPPTWVAGAQALVTQTAEDGIALRFDGINLSADLKRIQLGFVVDIIEPHVATAKAKLQALKWARLKKQLASVTHWRLTDGGGAQGRITLLSQPSRPVFANRLPSRAFLQALGGYRHPNSRLLSQCLGTLEAVGRAHKTHDILQGKLVGYHIGQIDSVLRYIAESAPQARRAMDKHYVSISKNKDAVYTAVKSVTLPPKKRFRPVEEKVLRSSYLTGWLFDGIIQEITGAITDFAAFFGFKDDDEIKIFGRKFTVGSIIKGLNRISFISTAIDLVLEVLHAIFSGDPVRAAEAILTVILTTGIGLAVGSISGLGGAFAAEYVASRIEQEGGLFAVIGILFETDKGSHAVEVQAGASRLPAS